MEVGVTVCLAKPKAGGGGTCISAGTPGTVDYKCPDILRENGFPITEQNVALETVVDNPASLNASIFSKIGADIANRKNTVVYAYGQRATPKRSVMLGTSASPGGAVGQVLLDIVSKPPSDGSYFEAVCYALGTTENVVDLVDSANDQGVIADSVKEGPRVRHVERRKVKSPVDVRDMMTAITKNYEQHFAKVLSEEGYSPQDVAMPPYNPDCIVFTLYRYSREEQLDTSDQRIEMNSVNFVILGDADRPALCGVDAEQLNLYEKTHKTLSSVVGILSAIRSNRLRIPFGKSKLTSILKRAYNAEKVNPFKDTNQPTVSHLVTFLFTDGNHAEEAWHALATTRRILSVVGGSSVGPASRDIAAEKWRLEQDIVELKDELLIAKHVHDYRPCIFDQAKPVQNIADEEAKRIAAIQKRREEAKDRAQMEMRTKAMDEARVIIEAEEKKTGRTLKELEKKLSETRVQNNDLQAAREKRLKEYDRHLEKIRKKRDEEETMATKLREELKALETELQERQAAIAKTKKQVAMLNDDHAKGREVIMKERESIQQQRRAATEQRRKQRQTWLDEIKAANEKVLEHAARLTKERRARRNPQTTQPEDDGSETEETVREDIESIERYLPKLITLDDLPADREGCENIRKQLEDYFAQEKANYMKKLDEEAEKMQKLEKATEQYRSRISEQQTRHKKDQLADAMKKEHHMTALIEQVMQFLEHGCRMYKCGSKGPRKRYYFLSEDRKKIHGCDVDENGVCLNRKKPSTTVVIADIKNVVLGQYTSNFINYAGGEGVLKQQRDAAMSDDGPFNQAPTTQLTPSNIGRYNYRSFSFEMRKGKTLDLVTETDSDCEAWVVALKLLVGFRTQNEKMSDKRNAVMGSESNTQIVWGAPLQVQGRTATDRLSPEEAAMCSEHHIAPAQYLKTRDDVLQKAHASLITIYDIRTLSSLDMLRSQIVHEFLVDKKLIQTPQ